jgi:hypothetical protein
MINERRCVGQIGHLNVSHGERGGRCGEGDEIHPVSLAIKERDKRIFLKPLYRWRSGAKMNLLCRDDNDKIQFK